jgi:hypothetical protein
MKIPQDEWHVLTGGYALDVLSGPEREAFEHHLRGCVSCQAEVRGLRETAARLALAAAVEPPMRMEQRVLAATYRIRQLPPLARDQVYRARRRARRPRLASERPGRDGRPARTSRLLTAVAAAGLAAAIALGVTQSLTQHQLDRARAGNAAITAVLAAPDARIEAMRTTVGGTVTVVTSRDEHDAVVITTGMPSLSPAQVYQLWVIGPAGARSAGLLSRTGQAGPVLATGVTSGDRIGITVEPSGGTSSPTTAPVIAIPVPA